MGNPKRTGKFGIGRTSSASATASPKFVIVCDNANISAEPKTYERINNLTPDDIGVVPAGFDHSFTVDGAEIDPAQFGYLWWLALGGQSIVSSEHVLVPANTPEYCEVFCDRNVDLGTSTPSQTAVGAMINKLSLDVQRTAMAKLSVGGVACNFGANAAALVAAMPAYPLNWAALRAGDFKIAYNGGSLASERTIRGIKIDYARTISGEDNIELDSDQPSSLTAHSRTLEFELTRVFSGAAALAEYNAWKNQQEVNLSLEMKVNSNAYRVLIEIPHARPIGPYAGAVGAGDDSILGTLRCKAFQSGSDNLIKVTVKDDTTVAYT